MMCIILGCDGQCYDGDQFTLGRTNMSAEQKTARCVSCERTVEEVPLLSLTHRQGTAYICPQCLPILIHEPGQLVSKLPGAETLQPHEH